MNKLKPNSPDVKVNTEPDQTLVRFGHLNWLIRRIAFLSEEVEEYTDIGTVPTGRKAIIVYTNTAAPGKGSELVIDIRLWKLNETATYLIVNNVTSKSILQVVATATRNVAAGEYVICTFIKDNWYMEY